MDQIEMVGPSEMSAYLGGIVNTRRLQLSHVWDLHCGSHWSTQGYQVGEEIAFLTDATFSDASCRD